MRVLIHSALFLMIASGPLPLAQSAAQPTDNQAVNTVSVTAEGTFETAPDTALFRFDITAQEKPRRQLTPASPKRLTPCAKP